MAVEGLKPSALLLLIGVLLDAVFGDPQYALHPIRLIGRTLTAYENFLRRLRWNGYGGGCLLLLLLAVTWIVIPSALIQLLFQHVAIIGAVLHVLVIFTLMALRDLINHVRAVE